MARLRLSQFWHTWTNRGLFSSSGYGPRAATEDLRRYSRRDWEPLLSVCRVPPANFNAITAAGGSLAAFDLAEFGRVVLRRTVLVGGEQRYFIHGLIDPSSSLDPLAVLISWDEAELWRTADDPAAGSDLPFLSFDDDVGSSGVLRCAGDDSLQAHTMMSALLSGVEARVTMPVDEFRATLANSLARTPREVRVHATFDDAVSGASPAMIANQLAGPDAPAGDLHEMTPVALAAVPLRYESHSRSSWDRAMRIESMDAASLLSMTDCLTGDEVEWVMQRDDVRRWVAGAGPTEIEHLLQLRAKVHGAGRVDLDEALQRLAEQRFQDLTRHIESGKISAALAAIADIEAATPSAVDRAARQLPKADGNAARLALLALAGRGDTTGAGVKRELLVFPWSLLSTLTVLLPGELAAATVSATLRYGLVDAPEQLSTVVKDDSSLAAAVGPLPFDGVDGRSRAVRLLSYGAQHDLVGDLTVHVLATWSDQDLVEALTRVSLPLNAGQWQQLAARVAGTVVPWLAAGPAREPARAVRAGRANG